MRTASEVSGSNPSGNVGRGGRSGLDREQVLRAALHLIDTEGLPTLTMRRLATELGVGVMTLYSYVRDKDDILDGVTELALRPLAVPPDEFGSWEQRLQSALQELYGALRAHPGATQILADGLVPGPTLDPIREGLLAILRRAGFDRGQAVTYLNALFSYVVGFAAVAGHHEVPSEAERRRIAALPPSEFPYLAGSASEFSCRFSGDAFDAGLHVFVSGLRNILSTKIPGIGASAVEGQPESQI